MPGRRILERGELPENDMPQHFGHDLSDPVNSSDHIRGDPQARVTVVEYGDFECPICRSAEPAVRMLLEAHPGAVRLVFRHYPIESAHPHALMAAEAAEAAGAQGRFWEMHDRLLEPGAHLKRSALDHYATLLGLDLASFNASLNDEIYRQRIREHMDGAVRSHVRGTPGFFVNGQMQDASGGMHHVREAVMRCL
jgi:protein-disulfide isomerase